LPELSIDVGDLRRLPYPDNSFDGYWSFGVIEHFWNGYDELLYEARRVLNEGGFLFLTFPTLSPLRQFKWRLGFYSKLPDIKFSKEDGPQGFYQFFLSHREVCSKLDEIGFDVIDHYFDNVQSGIKQELPRVYRVLSFILRMAPAFVRNKAIALAEEFAFFLGHLSVIVAKKKPSLCLDQ
jgi:ubiquinone/menaquinone biosynthesis C-methylase UbiE